MTHCPGRHWVGYLVVMVEQNKSSLKVNITGSWLNKTKVVERLLFNLGSKRERQ